MDIVRDGLNNWLFWSMMDSELMCKFGQLSMFKYVSLLLYKNQLSYTRINRGR